MVLRNSVGWAFAVILCAGCSERSARVDALEKRVAALEAKGPVPQTIPWILWTQSGLSVRAEAGYLSKDECGKAAEASFPPEAKVTSRDPWRISYSDGAWVIYCVPQGTGPAGFQPRA